MATDGSLSLRGKRILGQELAGLIERALNKVRRGTGLKQGLLELCQAGRDNNGKAGREGNGPAEVHLH